MSLHVKVWWPYRKLGTDIDPSFLVCSLQVEHEMKIISTSIGIFLVEKLKELTVTYVQVVTGLR